jgi:hypothetical protein
MTTPDYKSIALRLYGYGKFAEDYGYRADLASLPVTDRAYADYSRGQPLMDRIKAFAILIS